MEWSEEKYVKLYVRDTVTWLSWPWQARALWPALMRKLDGAGMLECGNTHPAKAVSLMVLLPLEVVETGLAAMLESGTLERIPNGLLAPKFLEGQEARKSDALRAREARERRRADIVLRKPTESGEPASHAVTPRHTPSQPVTLQPSPAQPSPAQKTLRAEKPPADPRHAPLVERLCEAFQQIKGTKYAFGGADGKAVQRLLAQGEPDEIVRRWRLALTLTHPDHSSLVDPKWWNRAAGTGPPSPQAKGALVTSNADWNNRTKSFEEELADGL